MKFTLNDIVNATGGLVVTRPGARDPKPVISGISTDTRTLQAGDLFVPLRGPRADGHDFIADAFQRGAAAALTTRPTNGLPSGAVVIRVDDPLRALGQIARAYRRTLTVTVVGVTGSVGKTTTTKLCAAVLARAFTVASTAEVWNAEIGVPLTLLGLGPQHQVAVIEMAMRGLGQITELVAMAAPSVGVVTCISDVHLEYLGSRENVARAKGELVAGLPDDGPAIRNRDDELVGGLARLRRGRVVTYGLAGPADVRADQIRFEPAGMAFRVLAGPKRAEARLPAWGQHNVANALAATAVGLELGMDLDAIVAAMAEWTPPAKRLQPVQLGTVLVINDTYNSSPASVRAALDVLEHVGQGRRLVVALGEMRELGAGSPQLHRDVGRDLAHRKIALVLTVGPGAEVIGEGAAAGGAAAGGDRCRAGRSPSRVAPVAAAPGDGRVRCRGSSGRRSGHPVPPKPRSAGERTAGGARDPGHVSGGVCHAAAGVGDRADPPGSRPGAAWLGVCRRGHSVCRRIHQRGQPHRWARWPRGRHRGDCLRSLCGGGGEDGVARGRGAGGCRGGRLRGICLVQRPSRCGLHGRHRVQRARCRSRRDGDRHPDRMAAPRDRARLCPGGRLGLAAGGVLQSHRGPADFPDEPAASPLRTLWVDGDADGDTTVDHRHLCRVAGVDVRILMRSVIGDS